MNTACDQDTPKTSESALDFLDFKLYWGARLLLVLALQILSVSIAWQVYEKTQDPFQLGLVGLFQFIPSPLLVLITGSVADHFNRKSIICFCLFVEGLCAIGFLYLLNVSYSPLWTIYLALVVFGIARSFMGPAVQSLIAVLVPSTALPNAIALNSSSFHLGTITGPILGGLLYGVSPYLPYFVSILFFTLSFFLVLMITNIKTPLSYNKVKSIKLLAGVNYIISQPIIFGALSLDLFAVLLAGSTALLPVFAKDILDVGAWGLGFLRSSPGIGALIMSLWLVHNPIRRYIGYKMFLSVFIYGFSIILFSLSASLWISSVFLILMGGADMVSVFIRQTLIQLKTPDDVRGRVSAVNMAFIGASNELGEFRAGTVASIMGSENAVLLGGVSAIGIAGLWMSFFPDLAKVNSLDKLD